MYWTQIFFRVPVIAMHIVKQNIDTVLPLPKNHHHQSRRNPFQWVQCENPLLLTDLEISKSLLKSFEIEQFNK